MKLFKYKELREATQFAKFGGQALHLYNSTKLPFGYRNKKSVPGTFLKHKQWGHLFDNNRKRLRKTAKKIGIQRVKIDREGTYKQHVDLCGVPLEKAKNMCLKGGMPSKEK
ncbi:MAG: hypothetical protein KAJ19_00510 [Gammaproteobacteria bacterium]|nr:hypothetical protein [Gammaproteobacteria bacterium]